MSLDTRSILESDTGSIISYDELKKRVLEVTRPTLATMLDDGDASVLLPQLSTFEIGPVSLPMEDIYEEAEEEDIEMAPEEGLMTPGKPSQLFNLIGQAIGKLKPVGKKDLGQRSVTDLYTDLVREKRRKQKISEGFDIDSVLGKRANRENSVSKKHLKKAPIEDVKPVLGKRTSEEDSLQERTLKR